MAGDPSVLARAIRENPRELPMRVGARFTRRIGASLERIWENVRDWEHLPHLHAGSFSAIELEGEGEWGWRARLVDAAGADLVVELVIDTTNLRYVSRTLEGPLPGTEIWTGLAPAGAHETDIKVSFHLPHLGQEQAALVGRRLAAAYQTLWDEDEAMMRHREQALGRRPVAPPARLCLGSEPEVRARLPITVDWGGWPLQIVDLEGELHAYVSLCPHMLGPLEGEPAADGCITCPWHGYRFDLRSGCSADGRGLVMIPAPRVIAEGEDICLVAEPAGAG